MCIKYHNYVVHMKNEWSIDIVNDKLTFKLKTLVIFAKTIIYVYKRSHISLTERQQLGLHLGRCR